MGVWTLKESDETPDCWAAAVINAPDTETAHQLAQKLSPQDYLKSFNSIAAAIDHIHKPPFVDNKSNDHFCDARLPAELKKWRDEEMVKDSR